MNGFIKTWNLRAATLVFLTLGAFASCWGADSEHPIEIRLAEQPLAQALSTLSIQAGVSITAPDGLLAGRSAPALTGTMTVAVAMDRLLQGSGLTYSAAADGSISVVTTGTTSLPPERAGRNSDNTGGATELTEVVVTANKRNESERSVAGSLTALTGRQLKDIGAEDFADYLQTVPGVQFNNQEPGQSIVSMRGVNTSTSVQNSQSPVGLFFEEVPLTDPYGVVLIPDLDTFDTEQIEILKGPQGALFGSGAIGGAINYRPNRAESHEWETQLESTGTLGKGDQLGGSVKGMINVPIVNDHLALRVVAYDRYEPGYIDNVGLGVPYSNDTEVLGGRAMADWNIVSGTSLSVTALHQRSHNGDQGYDYPGMTPDQHSSGVLEFTTGVVDLADMKLDSDLGFARMVGIAGYQRKRLSDQQDISFVSTEVFGPPGTLLNPVTEPTQGSLHGYTTELRLVSTGHSNFQWLAGAFYADRHEGIDTQINALGLASVDSGLGPLNSVLDPAFGAVVGPELAQLLVNTDTLGFLTVNTRIDELAGYVDASYQFGPHWKLSAGGREYHNRVNEAENEYGSYLVLTAQEYSLNTGGTEIDTGFNPRVSLSYTPTENSLIYALYSRGYALGGVNFSPPTQSFTPPPTYGPSKLYNGEVGVKSSWLHHRLTIDVTPFYIYWKDIPLTLSPSDGLLYQANVGGAHNKGVEAAVTALPFKHLTLTNTVTYVRADLSNNYSPGGGEPIVPAGTPLPGTPLWQGATIATYRHPILGLPSQISVINRYVGPSNNSLQTPLPRQGAYDTIALRGGVTWSHLKVELFVNNLTDRHGIASTVYATNTNIRDFIIQPRLFGLQLGLDLP